MIPIYEQGHGNGIGHGLDSFLRRFDEICKEHLESKRANAFAFIFYDFMDEPLRRVLKNQGVFAQLDRLSGAKLSIFYLHTGSRRAVERFNSAFLAKLSVEGEAVPPCVVFFSLRDDKFVDVAVAQLNNADLIHGFSELYEVIEHYVENAGAVVGKELRWLKWLRSSGSFFAIETFRAALRRALELVF